MSFRPDPLPEGEGIRGMSLSLWEGGLGGEACQGTMTARPSSVPRSSAAMASLIASSG